MSDIEAVQNVMFYQHPYDRELGGHNVVSSLVRFQYKANGATFSVVNSFVETLQLYLKTSARLDPGSELSMDPHTVTEQILSAMEASGAQVDGLYTLMYERLEDANKDDAVDEVFSLMRIREQQNVSVKLEVNCLPMIEVQESTSLSNNRFISFYIDPSITLHHRAAMLTWLENHLEEYWTRHLKCHITMRGDDLSAMYAGLRQGILGSSPIEPTAVKLKNGYMAVILLSENPGYRLVEYRPEGPEASRVVLSHSF